MQYLNLLIFFILFKFYLSKSETVTLNISNRQILGAVGKTQNKQDIYYAFKGIRYGKAKRFEPSNLTKPWKGIYNATYDRPTCIQFPKGSKKESENCLYLSVYTPKVSSNNSNLLPVMFWIHGGCFLFGNSLYSTYGPDYLLEENIIVVTINYRLGLFGFLSSGDEDLPGNLGLKDLILGLQWVQETIKYFGGNSKNVTIFGQSAGAALTSYLTLSPLTQGKGYFKRAILQSGSALATWAFQRHPRKSFNDVARLTNCGIFIIAGPKAVLECLKKLSSTQLRKATGDELTVRSIILLNVINGLPFTPVLEKPSESAALTETTYKKLLKNSTEMVPIIIGVNSEESMSFAGVLNLKRVLITLINLSKKLVVPADMYVKTRKNLTKTSNAIHKYYFDGKFLGVNTDAEDLLRFISDNFFVRQWRQYLEMLKEKTSVYCYVFTYNGTMGAKEPRRNFSELGSVGHSEDLNYLWRDNFSEAATFEEHDYIIRKRVLRLWTNFAKFGNPTPSQDEVLQNFTWRPTNYDGINNICLDISQNLQEIKNFKEPSYRMWKNLYDTFGKPRDTY